MTIATAALPRVIAAPRAAVRQLAWIEGVRVLRHPAPWIGLVLSVGWAISAFDQAWASARYEGLLASVSPLLLGVSLASVSTFGREHVPVSDDAPMSSTDRSAARLLGGAALVGLVALVVAAVSVWLRVRGGLELGDEPGRTAHAHYSVPELLQPVLLGCFAVALGAAVVHVVRLRLAASIALFLFWFLVGGTYWMFNGSVARWLAVVQSQPVSIEAGPSKADPTTFPSSWLLSAPGDFQDSWARLVVSPAMAGWHDLYLVALTMIAVAVAVPGRTRRWLLVAGALVGACAVLMQRTVTQ